MTTLKHPVPNKKWTTKYTTSNSYTLYSNFLSWFRAWRAAACLYDHTPTSLFCDRRLAIKNIEIGASERGSATKAVRREYHQEKYWFLSVSTISLRSIGSSLDDRYCKRVTDPLTILSFWLTSIRGTLTTHIWLTTDKSKLSHNWIHCSFKSNPHRNQKESETLLDNIACSLWIDRPNYHFLSVIYFCISTHLSSLYVKLI